MKFQLFMLPTVPGTLDERREKRPIARNNDAWQEMLEQIRELVIMADDMGFDCFSTTEHHFHSEGFEASVQPMMLYSDLAARTKNIKFAPLSLVLPANDPLRVAEQIAYLDHLTKGRVYGGYARGYQDRWVNVLGQGVPVGGTPMDGGDADKHNRKVHEEYLDIIYKAWTEDLLTYDGEFYQVPFPSSGITRWPPAAWTREYGAPGEVDDDGVVRGISVIPKPYQDPYPAAFQAFSVSESTIRHTATHGIMPMILTSSPPVFRGLCELYKETAAQAGRQLKLGESLGAFRSVAFGDTAEESFALMERTNFWGFQVYFSGFGFWEALRTPEDEERYPIGTLLPPEEWTMERYKKTKYGLCGSVDEIKRDFESLATIHEGDGELEWFGWFFDQGLMPMDEARRQLEMFATHIIPNFR